MMRVILTLLSASILVGVGLMVIVTASDRLPEPRLTGTRWDGMLARFFYIVVAVAWIFSCGTVVRWLAFRDDVDDEANEEVEGAAADGEANGGREQV